MFLPPSLNFLSLLERFQAAWLLLCPLLCSSPMELEEWLLLSPEGDEDEEEGEGDEDEEEGEGDDFFFLFLCLLAFSPRN